MSTHGDSDRCPFCLYFLPTAQHGCHVADVSFFDMWSSDCKRSSLVLPCDGQENIRWRRSQTARADATLAVVPRPSTSVTAASSRFSATYPTHRFPLHRLKNEASGAMSNVMSVTFAGGFQSGRWHTERLSFAWTEFAYEARRPCRMTC
eukprot:TRINITY_DN68183_c0_g1_i1.p1 TRINITY_DN68183_c0_g1~~TRINITY_DN68183_c0_g1_i1.p1  ORF type:complete len:149 (-),score=9.65 TRINITY_DN68183_c0_g1_i1:833-1279(-)